jgi:endonuclease/exonuclease/phosphatase family metal-dependent hydrolase
MRIMSCNIRYSAAQDGVNAWPHRREYAAEVIRSREPDVVCFQEMSREQYLFLRRRLADYDAVAMVDTPTGQSPQNAIFWRRERFAMISTGGYWLSETPHIAGTKSWDSSIVRLANWVRLALAGSGLEVRVIGTHLDHRGQTAREQQARLINEDASGYPIDYPQFLCGDMNATIDNPAIAAFLAGGWVDTYGTLPDAPDPGNTFHNFRGPAYDQPVGKIDWIFCRGRVRPVGAEIVRDACEGRYPSDHYFIAADVEFPS